MNSRRRGFFFCKDVVFAAVNELAGKHNQHAHRQLLSSHLASALQRGMSEKHQVEPNYWCHVSVCGWENETGEQ